MNMYRQIAVIALLVLTLIPWAADLYAAYADGGESQVQSFFDGTAGFLIKTIGTGVFLLGLIVAGIKIASGDHNGLRSAVMVMIGGAIIFLSKPIVGILAKLAGSTW